MKSSEVYRLTFTSLDNYELKLLIIEESNLMVVTILGNFPFKVFRCIYYDGYLYDKLTRNYLYISKLWEMNGLHETKFTDISDDKGNDTFIECYDYIKINLFNFPEINSYRAIKDILE